MKRPITTQDREHRGKYCECHDCVMRRLQDHEARVARGKYCECHYCLWQRAHDYKGKNCSKWKQMLDPSAPSCAACDEADETFAALKKVAANQ